MVDFTDQQRLDGMYRGIVMKHERLGRCKVFVDGIYPDDWKNPENVNKLPSAVQIAPIFGGSSVGQGLFSYPAIGSVVVCGFWNGDQNYPYYIGTVLGGTDGKTTYLQGSRSNVTESTVKDGTDVTAHTIKIANAEIKISEAGQVEIKTKSSTDDKAFGSITMTPEGNILLTCSGNVQIDCKNFKVNAQTAAEIDSKSIVVDSLQYDGNFTTKAATTIQQSATGHTIKCPTIYFDADKGTNGGGTVIAEGASRKPMPLAQ